MSLWKETKSRLRNLMNGVAGPDEGLLQLRADIRAMLDREEELERERDEARAEVARLREALEPISTLPCPVQGALGRPCGLCSGCLARAALAAAKGE